MKGYGKRKKPSPAYTLIYCFHNLNDSTYIQTYIVHSTTKNIVVPVFFFRQEIVFHGFMEFIYVILKFIIHFYSLCFTSFCPTYVRNPIFYPIIIQ